MRITVVLGAFLPVPPIMGGAVEKAWFALGQEFARRGHEVVQISRKVPQFPRTEIISGVRHLRVSGYEAPLRLVWLKTLDLFYSLRARQALPLSDIIVTNTFWLPILLRDKRRGWVYVHVGRFPKGQMRFYQHCARLQAPSRTVADAIKTDAPGVTSKVTVIPYPGLDSIEPPLHSFSTRAQRILYVGRIHPEKGVHLLIDAFANEGAGGFDGWKLVVIGPWESKLGGGGMAYWNKLQTRVAKAKSRIELRGPIFDPAALASELQNARLFVYPSLAEKGETFGLAPLEAMTHGCAVLVSNLGCFYDFIRDRETGFIFDHRAQNPAAALRSKMVEFVADESLLARVAEAGHRESERYALPQIADRFLQDFATVLETAHGPTTDR